MDKLMISGVIVTHNCQSQLPECLASLKDFVDEILIVDLESQDGTLDIARKYKAKVIKHKPVHYVELVRQFALDQAQGEWVILLDPDERLTAELKQNLSRIQSENTYAAVNIPRKNIFFGTWVRHTNFWPDRQIRFFKKTAVTWTTKIHSYPKVVGQTLNLPDKEALALVHIGYDSYEDFFTRQNRYSSVEAENLYSKGQRFGYLNLFWQPLREVLVRLVKHAGFLDGFLGLSLVYSLAIYQLTVQIKLWEKSQK